jgi:ABC-type nitrate/sulfonate/bicarbonate transport system ATPase subunit
MDAAISFARVSKRFVRADGSNLAAVEDISFAVAPGKIVALLGPSGSGKTTLLNIAAGLIAPDGGGIRIMGRETAETDWKRLAYMFQDDRLLPWRSATSNVALALEAGAMPAAERRRRSLAALARVELAAFADAYPHELSGGMRSRVALARSMVTEPEILLMDEPFARLDAQTRGAMHGELLALHAARPLAILFVTHDAEEAVALADEIIVLTARPGHIARKVEVLAARPRSGTPEAAKLVHELRAEVGGGHENR